MGDEVMSRTDVGIINASPLVFLSRAGHVELLRGVAASILVPRTVADEVARRGPSDPTARALESHPWLRIADPVVTPQAVVQWALGPGESSVLASALSRPGARAIIDDLAGRRCAAALGIPVIGTLGIVLVARRRGAIASARVVLEELVAAGMYLSRDVLDRALGMVGE
jgi:predicted nucleic acid-binding protein